MKKVTKVVIERVGAGDSFFVRSWLEGWQDGQAPDSEEFLEDTRMLGLMDHYKAQGFTVWALSQSAARALRGEITRVDVAQVGNELRLRKYPFGWMAKTPPIEEKVITQDQAQAARAWCEGKGWNVRAWPTGWRAFKGQPLPVRSRAEIQALRRRLEEEHYRSAGRSPSLRHFDLAFDY